MTRKDAEVILMADGNIEERIEREYRPFVEHDKEMSAWLSTVPHFGGWGEFYEVIEMFNNWLGFDPSTINNQPLNC